MGPIAGHSETLTVHPMASSTSSAESPGLRNTQARAPVSRWRPATRLISAVTQIEPGAEEVSTQQPDHIVWSPGTVTRSWGCGINQARG